MTPEISVLMPVRNGAAFLRAAIASILRQDFSDFELIVIDDGSTDATPALLAEFAAREPRLVVLRQPPLGLVAALNRGLEAAQAELVARMDADDVAMPGRLGRQREFLQSHPGIVLAGSAMQVIGADGMPVRTVHLPVSPAEIQAMLPLRNCIAHPTVMFRLAPVRAMGGYRGQFPQAEDYDLWLRLAEHHRLAALPAALLQYREHRGQVSWRGHEQRILSELAAAAAAAARRAGGGDPADGIACADRAMLRGCGWSEARIAFGVAHKAVDTARVARQAGQRAAARSAMRLALRQHPLGLRSRLRCLFEWGLSLG